MRLNGYNQVIILSRQCISELIYRSNRLILPSYDGIYLIQPVPEVYAHHLIAATAKIRVTAQVELSRSISTQKSCSSD